MRPYIPYNTRMMRLEPCLTLRAAKQSISAQKVLGSQLARAEVQPLPHCMLYYNTRHHVQCTQARKMLATKAELNKGTNSGSGKSGHCLATTVEAVAVARTHATCETAWAAPVVWHTCTRPGGIVHKVRLFHDRNCLRCRLLAYGSKRPTATICKLPACAPFGSGSHSCPLNEPDLRISLHIQLPEIICY